jgi:hypothetical protein
MRIAKSVLFFSSFALVVSAGARIAQADAPYSDLICPRAVPKVVQFKDASATNDLKKILAASRAAADAYKTCESEAVVRTYEEPYVNYDRTRAAQFMVVEGRALAATGARAEAIAVLRDAQTLADKVVEWQPQSQTYSASNGLAGNSAARDTDRSNSQYHDAAVQIVSAASDTLDKLGVHRQQTVPAPAAAASPKP